MAGLKDVAKRAGLDDELCRRFVDAIGGILQDGERVTIRGLGSFTPVDKPERTWNTPLMGEARVKPAHTAVSFQASTILLSDLNDEES